MGRGKRLDALDATRGFAVFLMLLAHFVSNHLEPVLQSWLGSFSAICALGLGTGLTILHGKGAALFCLLAGMSWSIMAQRHGETPGFGIQFFRRACALFVLGIVFSLTAWSTEVLSFFALYMVLCFPLLRRSAWVLGALILGLLVLTPVGNHFFGHYVQLDWRADGTFIEPYGFGWPMVRHYVFDGSYPVVPFLVLPLVGICLGRANWTPRFARRCAIYGLGGAALLQGYGFWAAAERASLGPWAPHLVCDWLPTSIPFILLGASASVGILGLFFLKLQPGRPRPEQAPGPDEGASGPWCACFVPLGRLSLTNYLAHIYFFYLPMTWTGFPALTGLGLALGYAWLGTKLSTWCLARWGQGPVERLLRWAAGSLPRAETP